MDGGSSPLSSPPESVVNVALGSPDGSVKAQAGSAEPTKSELRQPSAASGMERDRDSGQSSAEKRKQTIHVGSGPAKKPRRTLPALRKSRSEKKWEAPFVYTNDRSPLAQADLRAILLLPGAWDVLTEEEKHFVLSKFPDETHILDAGTPAARPNLASLRNDDNFRHDCATYCGNIKLGRHDEEWLHQAWTAHEKRKRGDYDEFLRIKLEEDWGVELSVESGHPAEGDSVASDRNEAAGSQTSSLMNQHSSNTLEHSEQEAAGEHAVAEPSE